MFSHFTADFVSQFYESSLYRIEIEFILFSLKLHFNLVQQHIIIFALIKTVKLS